MPSSGLALMLVFAFLVCCHACSGPLPSSWGQATGLTRLSFITVSMIEPVPASWSTMQQLESITVLSSQLSQLFLNSLTQLKQLHYIQLIDCWGIDLTLPEPWAEVASLEWVQAVNSTFTGRLPASWWARLHMLAHVSLERNRLTGELFTGSSSVVGSVAESALPGCMIHSSS